MIHVALGVRCNQHLKNAGTCTKQELPDHRRDCIAVDGYPPTHLTDYPPTHLTDVDHVAIRGQMLCA
jgi:hypothetical protein